MNVEKRLHVEDDIFTLVQQDYGLWRLEECLNFDRMDFSVDQLVTVHAMIGAVVKVLESSRRKPVKPPAQQRERQGSGPDSACSETQSIEAPPYDR